MALRRRSRSDATRPLAGGTRAARLDGPGTGWVDPTSGLGSEMDSEVGAWFEGGCPLSTEEIRQLERNNPFARGVTHREADDALREGFNVQGSVGGIPVDALVGGQPEEKLEEPDPIARWSKRFGVTRLAREGRSLALAHSSALWVFGVDDGLPSDQPLDFGAIQSLHWVKTVTGGRFGGRYSVSRWGANPDEPRFEEPTHYRVSFPRGGSAEFHWTRTWQWVGLPLSQEERAELVDFGGSSILDLVWTGLRGYGISSQLALGALRLLSQGVWQNEDLARAIDGGNAGTVAKNYERLRLGGGTFGDYVLDKGESYSVVGRPVTGMAEVMKLLRGLFVAASGQTEPVVLGAAPSLSGLNNDADAAVRAWLNTVAARWDENFGEALTYFYTIASRAQNGPTDGVPILALEIDHPPLWSPTPEEKAAVRKTNSEAAALDLASQRVTIAESRTDKTLVIEYTLTPQAELEAAQPEVQIEEIEVADDEDMPRGERPLSIKQAGEIVGMASGGTRGFIARRDVPLFRIGGQYRVFESHIREAMRGSRV